MLLGDERTPVAGTTFSVDMHVLWSVSRIDTQETVWQQLVASEATATVGDAFNAQNRARVATERAARQNIERAPVALAGAPL